MVRKTYRSRHSRLVTLMLLLLLPLLVFWQRNNLLDAWKLHGYKAPDTVVKLADQDKMTTSARHIFYVNKPQLMSNAQAFRADCTVQEQTIILGCYHGYQAGIFIYDVQDERLAGIQQVTAAHEMLHAAYDRLSANDRHDVDKMLMDYYDNQLSDQRVKDTINSYKKTEPDDLINEMHSIFGTEIANLPTNLENYYKRYFSDRSAVTNFSNTYENEFTSRENQAKALEDQLNSQKAKIDDEEASLRAQLSTINAQRAQLDANRGNDRNAYNAAVDSFNAQVDDYNAKVNNYQADVRYFNQLVSQYNDIAGDLRSLYSAINANLQTTSGQ